MLVQARDLISQVTQTGRVWLQGSEPRRANILLKAAPNWLYCDTDAHAPVVFTNLASILGHLPELGLEGIYLGELGEKPQLLAKTKVEKSAASLAFDKTHGTEAEYEQLAELADNMGIQLGSALLPAATSQGADFVLQARNVPGYIGLYAMVTANMEQALPPAKDEWDAQKLTEEALQGQAQVVPARLARDGYAWATPGGWAITGSVTGNDGQQRRLLYRYHQDVETPVIAWQDPAGLGSRLLSADIIKLTGLLGQTLVGINFEPLLGLEPADSERQSLSPGLEAINDLARQVHRYGGWAMQADALPASIISEILAGPCDFCRDDVTGMLVAFGLLAADGRPVAQLYRDWLTQNIEIARLARGLGNEGMPIRILKDNTALKHVWERLEKEDSRLAAYDLPVKDRETRSRFMRAWILGMPGLAFITCMPDNLALAENLQNTLKARKKTNLANGKVKSVTRGAGGGLGLLTELPEGGNWLLACNFGIHKDQVTVNLTRSFNTAIDVANGENLAAGLNGKVFTLPLDGRVARNILLE